MRTSSTPPSSLALATLALLAALTACRDSSGSGGGEAQPLFTGAFGADGCVGTPSGPLGALTALPLATWVAHPDAQVAAARGGELLFLTGADGQVVEVDLDGGPPVETELVAAGVIEDLLDPLHAVADPVLSGLAVLDDANLVVIERTFGVLLLVSRTTPDDVTLFAGLPGLDGGYADGPASLARFHFTQPAQVVSTADGRVLVADPGNHALRQVAGDFAETLAGTGAPGWFDGSLFGVYLDSPSGLALSCSGRLVFTELGAGGLGGHRLRALELGASTFFGQLGTVATLAGDGTAATVEGAGALASLAAPVGLVISADGSAWFVDRATGVLRRHDLTTTATDCPRWVDCATALTDGPDFTPDGLTTLALTEGGTLYALDAGAATLWRVSP